MPANSKPSSASQVATLDPQHAEAHAGLGICALRRGDHAAAEEAWTRALELRPADVDSALALAELLRASDRADDAERLLRALRCMDCHPSVVGDVTYGDPESDITPLEDFDPDNAEPDELSEILRNPEDISEDMPSYAHVPHEQRRMIGLFIQTLLPEDGQRPFPLLSGIERPVFDHARTTTKTPAPHTAARTRAP